MKILLKLLKFQVLLQAVGAGGAGGVLDKIPSGQLAVISLALCYGARILMTVLAAIFHRP